MKRILVTLAAIIVAGTGASAANADCSGLAPPTTPPRAIRAVTARDLVMLRDFGDLPGPVSTPPRFSLSPDGRHVAIELRQADPDTNRYCLGLFVVAIAGGPPRLIAQGGELIRDNAANRTLGDFPEGWPRTAAPRWSPDGRRIAWLRRDNDRTAIWTVDLEDGEARRISHEPADILDLAWTREGIVYATQPAIGAAEARLANEGRGGWVYDARFWPPTGDHPWPVAPFPTVWRLLDPVTGESRTATADERQSLDPDLTPGRPPDAALFARAPDGDIAWTAPLDPGALVPTDRLHIRRDGQPVACTAPACRASIEGIWWSGSDLLLMTGEGVDGSRTALWRWPAGAARPRPVLETDDLFQGCLADGRKALVCARETALRPRFLSRIDLRRGTSSDLFDPNPDYGRLRKGAAERLEWTNSFGRQAFGELVLPPDHRVGQTHPLIVVQYSARGFLRGGTGDEYPVQLFAARGFAVLCFDRPPDIAEASKPRTTAAWERINLADWADRRNVEASIEAGVALAETRGVVDPVHIGITGLSEGSTAVTWALLHSHVFSAAASSTCCRSALDFSQIGPLFRDQIEAAGYPRPDLDDHGFWRDFSLLGGAATMHTPLLLQLASAEFRSALATVDALQRFHQPVDMLVFPDEYHVKWQPAHRLAIYERNLCWFEYWFTKAGASCSTDDLGRWNHLRQQANAPPSLPPDPALPRGP